MLTILQMAVVSKFDSVIALAKNYLASFSCSKYINLDGEINDECRQIYLFLPDGVRTEIAELRLSRIENKKFVPQKKKKMRPPFEKKNQCSAFYFVFHLLKCFVKSCFRQYSQINFKRLCAITFIIFNILALLFIPALKYVSIPTIQITGDSITGFYKKICSYIFLDMLNFRVEEIYNCE